MAQFVKFERSGPGVKDTAHDRFVYINPKTVCSIRQTSDGPDTPPRTWINFNDGSDRLWVDGYPQDVVQRLEGRNN